MQLPILTVLLMLASTVQSMLGLSETIHSRDCSLGDILVEKVSGEKPASVFCSNYLGTTTLVKLEQITRTVPRTPTTITTTTLVTESSVKTVTTTRVATVATSTVTAKTTTAVPGTTTIAVLASTSTITVAGATTTVTSTGTSTVSQSPITSYTTSTTTLTASLPIVTATGTITGTVTATSTGAVSTQNVSTESTVTTTVSVTTQPTMTSSFITTITITPTCASAAYTPMAKRNVGVELAKVTQWPALSITRACSCLGIELCKTTSTRKVQSSTSTVTAGCRKTSTVTATKTTTVSSSTTVTITQAPTTSTFTTTQTITSSGANVISATTITITNTATSAQTTVTSSTFVTVMMAQSTTTVTATPVTINVTPSATTTITFQTTQVTVISTQDPMSTITTTTYTDTTTVTETQTITSDSTTEIVTSTATATATSYVNSGFNYYQYALTFAQSEPSGSDQGDVSPYQKSIPTRPYNFGQYAGSINNIAPDSPSRNNDNPLGCDPNNCQTTAVKMQFYFQAIHGTGDYVISTTQDDNFFYMFYGADKAYGNGTAWSSSSADMSYDFRDNPPSTKIFSVVLTQGELVPMAVVWINTAGPGVVDFTFNAPDNPTTTYSSTDAAVLPCDNAPFVV